MTGDLLFIKSTPQSRHTINHVGFLGRSEEGLYLFHAKSTVRCDRITIREDGMIEGIPELPEARAISLRRVVQFS